MATDRLLVGDAFTIDRASLGSSMGGGRSRETSTQSSVGMMDGGSHFVGIGQASYDSDDLDRSRLIESPATGSSAHAAHRSKSGGRRGGDGNMGGGNMGGGGGGGGKGGGKGGKGGGGGGGGWRGGRGRGSGFKGHASSWPLLLQLLLVFAMAAFMLVPPPLWIACLGLDTKPSPPKGPAATMAPGDFLNHVAAAHAALVVVVSAAGGYSLLGAVRLYKHGYVRLFWRLALRLVVPAAMLSLGNAALVWMMWADATGFGHGSGGGGGGSGGGASGGGARGNHTPSGPDGPPERGVAALETGLKALGGAECFVVLCITVWNVRR